MFQMEKINEESIEWVILLSESYSERNGALMMIIITLMTLMTFKLLKMEH